MADVGAPWLVLHLVCGIVNYAEIILIKYCVSEFDTRGKRKQLNNE
jgi:hypothetical protein